MAIEFVRDEHGADAIRFSSGRVVTVYDDRISISPSTLALASGYDQALYAVGGPDGYDPPLAEALTPAERAELADYYIAVWQRFKEDPDV